ncbi:hypothetical protein [Streptomyces sp. NPDC059909]|uniref:hypothetical protein n=1 Tax=Streptomyces sp. NPDC059909 TaxID=3346998 RepID=UPI0036568DF1
MTQQYPGPQQPYQPQPPYQGAPFQPQPPKPGMSTGAKVAIILSCVLGIPCFLGLIIAIGSAGEGTGNKPSDTVAVAPMETAKADDKPAQKEQPTKAPEKKLSQAEQFKAFVAKNGTAPEKAAVKHVTKVQGADKQNDFLDSASVYTDFKGGFMSEDQGKAKLIASAFADWKQSENGLVSVYGEDGELIANGNF